MSEEKKVTPNAEEPKATELSEKDLEQVAGGAARSERETHVKTKTPN